ncbi:MAG: hypothetical protein C5B47_04710 [Verrucomicrobia bacterium]|nr:MAG: hypothetical protein C5B47_04710 [Verrucomicrobiota bacterium]
MNIVSQMVFDSSIAAFICNWRHFTRAFTSVSKASISLILAMAFSSCSDLKPYTRPSLSAKGQNGQPNPTECRVEQRFLFIGDAGENNAQEPVLQQTLLTEATRLGKTSRTTIVFLGDNIYENGMPPLGAPSRKEAEDRLNAQIDVARKAKVDAVFIPGNHDWSQGLAGLKDEYNYLTDRSSDRSRFCRFYPYPDNPGPAIVENTKHVLLIALDTEWILQHQGEVPASSLRTLQRLVKNANGRAVIVVAHHPLLSHGSHGGFFDWRDHLFGATRYDEKDTLWLPTPILGTLFVIARTTVVRPHDDLASKEYSSFRHSISDALSAAPALIWVAGHDHSLQVLDGAGPSWPKGRNSGAHYVIVSGLGSHRKATTVTHGSNTLFDHLSTGVAAVDVMTNGDVLLRIYEPGHNNPLFSKWLYRHRHPV